MLCGGGSNFHLWYYHLHKDRVVRALERLLNKRFLISLACYSVVFFTASPVMRLSIFGSLSLVVTLGVVLLTNSTAVKGWLRQIGYVILGLSLGITLFLVHETPLATQGESGWVMLHTSNWTLRYRGKEYTVTCGDTSWTSAHWYRYNVYAKDGIFYRRVNRKLYEVTATTVKPERTPKWIFKNIILAGNKMIKVNNESSNPNGYEIYTQSSWK